VRWRERDGLRWLEAELPGARAAFSARLGGVSEPPYESLNLAILTGDEPDRVRENRHRFAGALGLDPTMVVIGRQVHGDRIYQHDGPQRPSTFADPGAAPPPEVDGHHSERPGIAALVFVADCLPVALSGAGGIAMLHCGWRGLAADLVESGVQATRASAAAIGPGIGPCCYEVGPEVLERFASHGAGVAEDGRLDLVEVTRRQLEAAGVGEIDASDLCTSCSPDLFYSHRRDGARTGRQAGVAWLN
jgi:YfiH family protein